MAVLYRRSGTQGPVGTDFVATWDGWGACAGKVGTISPGRLRERGRCPSVTGKEAAPEQSHPTVQETTSDRVGCIEIGSMEDPALFLTLEDDSGGWVATELEVDTSFEEEWSEACAGDGFSTNVSNRARERAQQPV